MFTALYISTFFCASVYVCLRNDLYCVEWGVKLYSLTHPVYVCMHQCALVQFLSD